jgi:hypothetical protein
LGFVFRVSGFGFRVQDFGLRVSGSRSTAVPSQQSTTPSPVNLVVGRGSLLEVVRLVEALGKRASTAEREGEREREREARETTSYEPLQQGRPSSRPRRRP